VRGREGRYYGPPADPLQAPTERSAAVNLIKTRLREIHRAASWARRLQARAPICQSVIVILSGGAAPGAGLEPARAFRPGGS